MEKEFINTNIPTWEQSMMVLMEHIEDILKREQDNEYFIHLYGFGNHWIALERSAYLLCQINLKKEISILQLHIYPFPLVAVSITDGTLKTYTESHILKKDSPDYKIIITKKLSTKNYLEWHKEKIMEIFIP